MAKEKLSAKTVEHADVGMHGDGNGLWFRVVTAERKAWLLRYTRHGRVREMGLGAFPAVSLAEARDKAKAARKLLAADIDPIGHREAARLAEAAEQARATTFAQAAAAFIAAHKAGWRNDKHAAQWESTLRTYAEPSLGKLACAAITTADILAILRPIWAAKPETASRLRGRIEQVLDYAKAHGWRSGENPAAWRGNLALMLPPRSKVAPVVHHAALDWHEAPAFMAAHRAREGMGARALEFAILTAARSGEVRGARWSEINLDRAEWNIPAERMKTSQPHRVPLSEPTLAILREMAALTDGSGLVFLGQRKGVPMSDMTLTAVLRRMGCGHLTAHGFRSTFRDWAGEATPHASDVVEVALAHTVGSKVRQAYQRGDMFAKRRALMDDWADYLARAPAEVVRPRFGQQPAAHEVVA
jgi:integrase